MYRGSSTVLYIFSEKNSYTHMHRRYLFRLSSLQDCYCFPELPVVPIIFSKITDAFCWLLYLGPLRMMCSGNIINMDHYNIIIQCYDHLFRINSIWIIIGRKKNILKRKVSGNFESHNGGRIYQQNQFLCLFLIS